MTSRDDFKFRDALQAELDEVDKRIAQDEKQLHYFSVQFHAAKEYRERLVRLVALINGESIPEVGDEVMLTMPLSITDLMPVDPPSVAQKVLREQALRARLRKTDMSPKARLKTLVEAERKDMLDEASAAELLDLRRSVVESKNTRPRAKKTTRRDR